MFRIKGVENVNKNHTISSITFPENSAVYEILWKNMVQPGRPKMTI